MSLRRGARLAERYRLDRPLGEGSQGSTWLARDELRDREVVCKVCLDPSDEVLDAYAVEFRVLRGLYHPRLVRLLDHGRQRQGGGVVVFHTLDPVRGEPLARWAPAASAPWEPILDALEGLAVLHAAGILHNDVSPANVLVEDGRGVLVDLGCARPLPWRPAGHVLGTLGHIAPEALAGAEVIDARADLYAIGRLLRTYAAEAPAPVVALARVLSHEDPDARPPGAAQALMRVGRAAPADRPDGRARRLVGRTDALEQLDVALDALEHGRGGRLAFQGPDGVGKSALLRELRARAQLRARTLDLRAGRDALARALGARRPGALGMIDAAAAWEEPVVIVIDDADRLGAEERRGLEAAQASARVPTLLVEAGTHLEGATPLEPLSGEDLAAWAPRLDAEARRRLHRATGGHPRDVERALEAWARGATDELSFEAPPDAVDLDGLGDAARDALADRLVDPTAPLDEEPAVELAGRGLIGLDDDGSLTLRRPALRAPLLEALGAERRRRAHLRALARRPEASAAERVAHLAGADDVTRALGELRAAFAADPTDASLWAAARGALELPPVLAAQLARAAGRPEESQRALRTAVLADPALLERAAIRRELAWAYLLLGDPRRAARHAAAARRLALDSESCDLGARAANARGRYPEARALAERGLGLATSADARGDLEESLAVALLYTGEARTARERMERALAAATSPRSRIRRASYAGIAAFHEGAPEDAARLYGRAVELAEEAGLADQLATASMNRGTASQRLGRLAAARADYERAARIAAAIGKRSTALRARFNLANLHAAIGDLDAARASLPDVDQADDRALRASAAVLRGELALMADALDEAESRFTEASALAAGARAAIEADLGRLTVAQRRGMLASADLEALLARARGEGDLFARALALEAERRLIGGEPARALEALEAALAAAAPDPDLTATLTARLARAADEAGAPALGARHRASARATWERMALGLDPAAARAFWSHPARAELASPEPPSTAPAPAQAAAARAGSPTLERVLEINRQLTEALDPSEVLARALDAAIELTEAERGFVLLATDDGPEVAVARSVDGERLGRSHVKFSRTIAQQVIGQRRAIVTANALGDERFSQHRSVLAMRLTSVACVPIATPREVLGAIYVDNRFAAGRFDAGSTRLLQMFADQVAVALINARLHASLTRRTGELEAERARVRGLLEARERELDALQRAADPAEAPALRHDFSSLVAQSGGMRRLVSILDRVSSSPLDLLLRGESGTGKERVARAVHRASRSDEPFVALNCAAVPAALFESELFGHTRGAFTDADREREGILVSAGRGTVLLDEIGELPLSLQVKLLRALQEREVRPLGSNETRAFEARVICATHRDLAALARRGQFREDLYYRIAVVDVVVPPLRERLADLPRLAESLLERASRELSRPPPKLTADALRALAARPWPGNVRELENTLRRALVLAGETDALRAAHLEDGATALSGEPLSRDAYASEERARLLAELRATRWNVSAAARRLGMARNTLYRRLERYRIEREP